MSKLSLSRKRGPTSGPITSTQVPRQRPPPVEGLSREELLFQRQLDAALKKSKAEFEKGVVSENEEESTDSKSVDENIPPTNVDEKSDRKNIEVKKVDNIKIVEPSEADTVIISNSSEANKPMQPAAVQPEPAVGRLTSYDSESEEEEVVEVGESDDDSDFCPGSKKKEQQPKLPTKPALKVNAFVKVAKSSKPEVKKKPEITLPSSPVPSTSGIKKPRKKTTKYALSDSEESEKPESDSDDDDEFYTTSSKTKRQRQVQSKKATNPPVKKSRTSPPAQQSNATSASVRSAPATVQQPDAGKTVDPHPGNFHPAKPQPAVPVKPVASGPSKNKRTLTTTPAPKSVPAAAPAHRVSNPPAIAAYESVKTTPPISSRPVRTLIPKWTPPAMTKSNNSSSADHLKTPSPGIGLRVGLSRNFKPSKPLHPSFKAPD